MYYNPYNPFPNSWSTLQTKLIFLTGNGNQDLFVGSSAPFGLSKDSFVINMLGFAMTQFHRGGCGGPGTISAEQAMEKNWHVKYVAVGHTCPTPEL